MTDLDRPMAERLWQLYSHDLSQYRGMMPNAEGLYKAGRLPTYFGNPDTCGYVVTHDGANAGFVFVTGLTGEFRTVGDFFVVRAARRQRVGFDAAMHVLTRHRGPWEIGFQVENLGAPQFWRGVATEVAGSRWHEELRPVPNKPHIPHDHFLLFSS